jgi:hypothetical protein
MYMYATATSNIRPISSVTGDWIVHATRIQPSHQEDRAGSTIGKTTRQRIIGSGSGLEYLRRMYLRPSESAELDCVVSIARPLLTLDIGILMIHVSDITVSITAIFRCHANNHVGLGLDEYRISDMAHPIHIQQSDYEGSIFMWNGRL